jgi:DNA-directed RNA polymerase specialized sigma24 family protein
MGESGVVVAAVRDRVEVLYRDDGDRLWRALAGFAGDPSVADEAVAEAFAQLLRRGDEVRDPQAWVWRAAFRIAAGELKRRGEVDLVLVERAMKDPEPAWGLVEALQVLSDQQRAVVILRDYVGHSGRATARILGTTEPSVRVQLSRARRALREELSR